MFQRIFWEREKTGYGLKNYDTLCRKDIKAIRRKLHNAEKSRKIKDIKKSCFSWQSQQPERKDDMLCRKDIKARQYLEKQKEK